MVKTYGEILNSRSTLERLIEKTGINYTWQELSKMIASASSNNTGIMKVTVTTEELYEAAKIPEPVSAGTKKFGLYQHTPKAKS